MNPEPMTSCPYGIGPIVLPGLCLLIPLLPIRVRGVEAAEILPDAPGVESAETTVHFSDRLSDSDPRITVVHRSSGVATASERVQLSLISGIRFGGLIGGSLDNCLTYETFHAVIPEVFADVGVSGSTFGLGARWRINASHWRISGAGMQFEVEDDRSVTPRLIATYRWEHRHRAPSLWRGMLAEPRWYFGGEISMRIGVVGLDLAVTVRPDHTKHPYYTLGYGVGF